MCSFGILLVLIIIVQQEVVIILESCRIIFIMHIVNTDQSGMSTSMKCMCSTNTCTILAMKQLDTTHTGA